MTTVVGSGDDDGELMYYPSSMRARFIVVLLTLAGVVATPRLLASSAEEVLYGAWRLDLGRSTYGEPSPFLRARLRIAPQGENLRITYDTVGRRGGVIHIEWNGRFDGRDYLLEGVDEYVTNAYRWTDEHTYEVIVKVDERPTAATRVAISPDGRTLTSVSTESDAQGRTRSLTTVWEKED
jgi:hypothetical protein